MAAIVGHVVEAVVVRGLTKSYGERRVLDGVELSIEAGDVCVLLGPNGAGKTTLTETLAGLRAPDSGTVRVLGHDPRSERAAVVERLGVMLQEGGAWAAASPEQMLRLSAKLYRDPLDVGDLLERLELGLVARSRYRTLSGGEKQRVGLALALVGRPAVALLDEPTTGMDIEARHTAWELIRGMRAEGVTVLLTTHQMAEAEQLADRVAVLARGRLLAHDPPSVLIDEHASDGVTVTSPAEIDEAALAAAVGTAVDRVGEGRWHLPAMGAAAEQLMATVPAWFVANDVPLTGVTRGTGALEEAYLALTRRAFGPAATPTLSAPDNLQPELPEPTDRPDEAAAAVAEPAEPAPAAVPPPPPDPDDLLAQAAALRPAAPAPGPPPTPPPTVPPPPDTAASPPPDRTGPGAG